MRPDRVDPLVLSVQAFCSGEAWPLIGELQEGDEVSACYLVLQARRQRTKNDQPYLRLLLGDRSGSIEAMIWDDVDEHEAFCVATAVVGVRGSYSTYNDKPQLRINTIQPLNASPAEMERLLAASHRDPELMERELEAHIASVRDRPTRLLLRRCLGRDTASGKAFRAHPAATRNHHAYLYGLLEHTLSVAGLCDRLFEHYKEQGTLLDRDLLMTGALLHDIGKTVELEPSPTASYTTAGKLLGHIVLGMQLVEREAARIEGLSEERRLLIQHLIASHQGKPEWDSPRVPQTLEAVVLHYADDLDAKLNQATAALNDVEAGEWSGYDRSLGRAFYRPASGAGGSGPEGGDASESVIDLFGG